MKNSLEGSVRRRNRDEGGQEERAASAMLVRRKKILVAAERVRTGQARVVDITDLSDEELYARYFDK